MKTHCACNKRPCEGICKEANLFRQRKDLDICPAVYDPEKEKKQRYSKED